MTMPSPEARAYTIDKLNQIKAVAVASIEESYHQLPGFSASYWTGRRAEARGIIAACEAAIQTVGDETVSEGDSLGREPELAEALPLGR